MSRTSTVTAPALARRRVLFNRNIAQKILLTLVLTGLAAIPLWLGLEHVRSAAVASPPLPLPPSVSALNVPAQVLIGEQFKFTVKFKNNPSVVGFAPFLDLVLDTGGAGVTKPGCACDGITFVSAKMVGVNGGPIVLPPTLPSPITGPCSNSPSVVTHPFGSFAVSGIQPVTVPAGAQFVTLELPFGSFDPTQPDVEIEVTAQVSNLADYNYPLRISARSGFRYGADPLNNPASDHPILSDEIPLGTQVTNSPQWLAQATTKPQVFIAKKEYKGPEDETAVGPNYPHNYKITTDIANTQSIANLKVHDFLPNNMQYQGLVGVTIHGNAATQGTTCSGVDYVLTKQPPTIAAQNTPTNELEVSFCHPIIGTSVPDDVTVTFKFFIPILDANGNPVLHPNCVPTLSVNRIMVEGDWTPQDPCDQPNVHLVTNVTAAHKLADKCLAIQKSVTIATDSNAPGLTPGDILRYELNFQLADPKTFGDLNVVDFLSDGQQLLLGPPVMSPKLTVKDQFGTVSGIFLLTSDLSSAPSPPIPQCAGAARLTKLTFQVSTKMNHVLPLNPRHAAGILTGGYARTPNSPIPATGQIVFFAKVLDQFSGPYSTGDQYVDKDDPMTNCVLMTGRVLTNLNPVIPLPTATTVVAQDDSKTATAIITDTIEKKVYAVKRGSSFVCGPSGPACSNFPNPPQEVRPGDDVTFQIDKIIPSTDAEQLTVQDWLPQPKFVVASSNSFMNMPCGIPGPGQSCLGPGDTLHTLLPLTVPAFVPHTSTNSIEFKYGNFNDPNNQPHTIELLFTSTVTNQPAADGLQLTNEAQECENNTFGVRFCQAAIAQVKLREPNLHITKGIVATNNPHGVFSPSLNPSGKWKPFGTSCPRFNGTINSTTVGGLSNSNLSDVDANDKLTYAIAIENTGGSPAFEIQLADIFPVDALDKPNCFDPDFSGLCITDGSGTPIPFTTAPGGHGRIIIKLAPGFSLAPGSPSNSTGTNIAIITFNAQLRPDITPGCCDNIAQLRQYTSQPGGPDFVGAGFTPPFSDSATVCVNPTLTKTLVATSEAHTTGSDVTIGEIARYRLVTLLPEGGLLPNFQVTDALPAGMKFLPGTARLALISNGPGITHPFPPVSASVFNVIGSETTLPFLGFNSLQTVTPTGGAACGAPITFNLGNIQNNDNDNDLEYIVIEFDAQVCNVATNVNNTSLSNKFSVVVNNTTIATSPPVNVTVVEPHLTITKAASPTGVVQGGTVAYTVTVTNTSPTKAFDVQFTDTMQAGLTFVSNSTTVTGACAAPTTVSTTAPAVTCSNVAGNGVVTIKYNAIANPATCPATLTNHAAVTWTSLPGPKGTAINPTLSDPTVVLGSSGANNTSDGERNGVTTPLTLNNYAATFSVPVTVKCSTCLGVSNEVLTCNSNGTFNYTFTVTNQGSFPVAAVTFSPITSNVTITPGSLGIPVLAAGASTNVTVTISGSGAVSGASICFWVGLAGPVAPACRIQHCLTLPSCQTSACATPPAGMVAWWPLDETSGNVVHSIVGNHDGTTLPGPIGTGSLLVATAPKVGSALFFGAAKAEVQNDPALNFGTGDFSIDAWVRSNQPSLLSAVVDKLDTSTPARKGYAFFVQNGRVQLVMANGTTTSTFQSNNTFVANGTWRHVAVTVRRLSGGPVGQFYLDGAPVGPTFTPLAGNIDSSATLLIGNYRLSNSACSCEVSLDEIELFNTVVPPSAIKSIFQADKNGKCKATISGFKFNDLNGNHVRDTGEPGLGNWTIKVTDSSGNTQTTTTDSSGNYTFTVPGSGTYTVSEVLQPGWIQTAPTSGTYPVTVSGGQVVNNQNFGNRTQQNQCDLKIKKEVKPNPVVSGQQANVSVTVTNVGTGPCHGPTTVTESLTTPPVSAGGPGWTCAGAACTYPSAINAGASVSVTYIYNVTAQPGTVITNCVTLKNASDSNQANDRDCIDVKVVKPNSSSLTKRPR